MRLGRRVPVSTVRAFARTFLADCAERDDAGELRGHMRRWMLPAFGTRPVDATPICVENVISLVSFSYLRKSKSLQNWLSGLVRY